MQHSKSDINPISHSHEVTLTGDTKADAKSLAEAVYRGLQKCQCTYTSKYTGENFLLYVQSQINRLAIKK